VKNRHDAWTHEEDILLAKTVLKHIKDGSTRAAAFNEISDLINRTPAACSYRWNAEVRKEYENDVELAKKKHMKNKRKSDQPNNKNTSTKPQEDFNIFEEANTLQTQSDLITINDCMIYLSQLINMPKSNSMKEENDRLLKEKQALYKKNKELVEKYEKLMMRKHKLEEEYKVLMVLIQHAQNTSEEELKQKKFYH
jgi:prespore-specific regulator